MKIALLFLMSGLLALASCSQHTCPTYANSGIKYHKHMPGPHSHH